MGRGEPFNLYNRSMVRPGPLSPADAAYLNDQLRELEVLKRRVESLLGQAPELIPAAVTSATTISWTTVISGTTQTTYSVVQHGWYEQGHDVQGTRVTLIGGRSGTNLVDPARTPSGSIITPTPTPSSPVHVWLRKTGLAATHGMIHEVLGMAGSGGAARFVTFGLASTITTTITSVTSCTVYLYWGGDNPGANVTVHNVAASATTTFIFFGNLGNRGIATWDEVNSKWHIIQMQC